MHDKCDKVSNYLSIFINYIKDNNVNIVLWWFINIPTTEFIHIKQVTNVKYIFFNWDEPYNWIPCDIISKMKYFDAVFVTCSETLQTYKNNGCAKAICLYPGFDPKKNYILTSIDMRLYNKYNCDISFCCTNLYDDPHLYPNQYISRKKLIDDVYIGQKKYGYKFNIYGPCFLNELYPDSYKGFTKYDDLNNIFNFSKINLCTHVLNNKDGYLNERVILIGGSGGLLLVDYVKGIENIFEINNEILVLDKHYYVDQIASILCNYDKYITIRKNLNNKCNLKFTYDVWAKSILDVIM